MLVDIEQGGRTALESYGLNFASAITLSAIAKYSMNKQLAGE